MAQPAGQPSGRPRARASAHHRLSSTSAAIGYRHRGALWRTAWTPLEAGGSSRFIRARRSSLVSQHSADECCTSQGCWGQRGGDLFAGRSRRNSQSSGSRGLASRRCSNRLSPWRGPSDRSHGLRNKQRSQGGRDQRTWKSLRHLGQTSCLWPSGHRLPGGS